MFKFQYYTPNSNSLIELEFNSMNEYNDFKDSLAKKGTEIVLGQLKDIATEKLIETYTDFYYLLTIEIKSIENGTICTRRETMPYAGSLVAVFQSEEKPNTTFCILFAQRISKIEFILFNNKRK